MTTLYEKVGNRYRPVREERMWGSWPRGFHLVYADPEGGKSYRFNIDPDRVGLIAAAKEREGALRQALNEALAMRPTRRPVTERQAKAWNAFKLAMGADGYIVEYAGVLEVIDRMIDVLVSE